MSSGSSDARAAHAEFLRGHHRPTHARRRAERHAAFVLPHLRPGALVLDLGCGPGSITQGLADAVAPSTAVGVDLDPERADGIATPAAVSDAAHLPIADATIDAVFACALLQHVPDPLAVLVEARRVCRPGAVIGIADADWDGFLVHPTDPLLVRGQEILLALRSSGDPTVGKRLRGLLAEAGFDRPTATATTAAEGDANTAFTGAFRAASFEAPSAVALAESEGIASADEMAAVADAWRRWGEAPGAFFAGFWVEALAWVDGELPVDRGRP